MHFILLKHSILLSLNNHIHKTTYLFRVAISLLLKYGGIPFLASELPQNQGEQRDRDIAGRG